jgi:lysophospholipase L1-like esterase
MLLGGELYSQVGRYQAYWNRQNEQPPIKNELVYVALGDSTAQGIGASKPQKGYVGLVAAELAKQSGRPVRTMNFSKSGAKLSDALERQVPLLQKCNIPSDAIITIEIGANDMGNFNAAHFESQMDELMGKLPARTAISDIPYFGGSRNKKLEPNVADANVIMERLAKKHGFELVALHERMKNNSSLKTLALDGFHPSSYAYKSNWATAFLDHISSEKNREQTETF